MVPIIRNSILGGFITLILIPVGGCSGSDRLNEKVNAEKSKEVQYPLETYVDIDGKKKTRIIDGASGIDSKP